MWARGGPRGRAIVARARARHNWGLAKKAVMRKLAWRRYRKAIADHKMYRAPLYYQKGVVLKWSQPFKGKTRTFRKRTRMRAKGFPTQKLKRRGGYGYYFAKQRQRGKFRDI